MIKRSTYLKILIDSKENGFPKVITGIRRCGKSTLLNVLYREYLKEEGIKDEQIIYLDLTDTDNLRYCDPIYLNDYVLELTKNKNVIYYVFLDEIQNVDKWEKTVNSFKAKEKYSIFITGSNSDLLSGELATHIAGRYVSFKIYPFNFFEVCKLKNIDNNNKYELKEYFDDYIKWGGLPQRFEFKLESQIKTYLSNKNISIRCL